MRKRPRYSAPVRAQDFHCLDSPHPYGLLPQGNRFLVDNNDDNADDDANDDAKPKENGTTAAGDNSSSWIQLNDECWSHILSFAEGPLLAKVAQLNRYFYVQAHQPELWRDLVLRRIQGGGTIDVVEPSWKDTYARLFYPLTYRKPHCPMAVKGVYSDFLYRLHSCRCFCIPQAWLDNQESTIDRVVQGEITAERFFAEYEQPNKPLVIEGGAKSWEAFRKWPDALYCLQQTKGRTFRATSGVAPLPAQFSLQAYYKYGQMPSLEEAPVYLFDRTALFPNSPLWQDFYPDLCQSLPFWDPQHPQHDLFQYLGEGARPDHTWWIVGPRRSGSVFHIDPNCTHAWNAAIVGRKRWIFYPPGVTPPGVHPSDDGDSVALPLSVGEWLLTFWSEHCQRKHSAPRHERPLETTALPGDVVFVPHGWWHMVINLDDVNVAITHNYVAKSNLSNVLKFLSEKRDQVSGCRDRREAIQPECLYEAFVAALESKHPDWLKEALNEPDWTCAAWSRVPTNDNNASSAPLSDAHKASSGNGISIMSKAKTEDSSTFSFSFL